MKQKKLLIIIVTSIVALGGWHLCSQQQIDEDRVTLISFNDFHGAYAPTNENPGAARFVDAILEEKENSPNAIILSGGDNISGSYFARITRGKPYETFKAINNDLISVVGNHEFDWGKSYLVDTAAVIMTYLTANMRDTVAGAKFNERIKPYKIVQIPVFENSGQNLDVGIIGITTNFFVSDKSYVKDLKIDYPNAEHVQQYCDTLKNKDVDMIVLLMHVGTKMQDGKAIIMDEGLRELGDISDIDAIISAHSHDVVLGKTTGGIPIIQAGTNGQYIGKLSFSVTRDKNKKLAIKYISGDTIKVATKGNLNKIVDNKVIKLIDKHKFNIFCTVAEHNLIHDRTNNPNGYTEVGTLVTASYVDAYNKFNPKESRPIIGINHFKGIRTGIDKGEVTVLQAGNVLPFGGILKGYEINGKVLKELFLYGRKTIGVNKWFLQSSNIAIQLAPDDSIKHFYIIDTNGKRKEIKDDTNCVIVCDSYIATGGDGFNKEFFKDEIKGFKCETTDAFIAYLKEQKTIPNNSAQLPKVL